MALQMRGHCRRISRHGLGGRQGYEHCDSCRRHPFLAIWSPNYCLMHTMAYALQRHLQDYSPHSASATRDDLRASLESGMRKILHWTDSIKRAQ